MDLQNIWLSFLLTSLGGLTTVIGGLIAISGRKPGGRLLSLSMGFAAGIMLFVSFTEMLSESREHFERVLSGEFPVMGATFLAFFGGMILVTVISALLPEEAHNHVHVHECGGHHGTSLYRTGLITAAAISLHNLPEGISLHNLPEGLATFSATTAGLSLGLPLIIAVTLHNIPIGLSIALPVYAATGKKRRAVLISLLSGFVTVIGAGIGVLLLGAGENDLLMGALMGAVAGIMAVVALAELYPAAREHGSERSALYSLIAGMIFMAGAMLFLH